MADGFSYSFTGNSSVVAMLHNFEAVMGHGIQGLLEKHGQGTLDDAQAAAPVLTGTLRDSGYVTNQRNNVEVGFTAPYAEFVEEGHHTRSGSFVPPQHFLEPAFLSHEQQFADDLKSLVP